MNAIVVGSTKGIGAAIYEQLCLDEHKVVGMSRSAPLPVHDEDGRQLTVLDQYDPDGRYWRRLDLQWTETSIQQSIYDAVQHLGGLDWIVISAGLGLMQAPWSENRDDDLQSFTTNYFGPVAIWRGCVKDLMRNQGHCIYIGSTCANRPSRGMSVYRASKAAAQAYFLNKGHEYAGRLRCNVVAPGWVETPMTADLKPKLREKIVNRLPLGRFEQPEEVANYVCRILGSPSAPSGQLFETIGG